MWLSSKKTIIIIIIRLQRRRCRRQGFNPGSGRSLEKEMATDSSILAWITDRGGWRALKELDTLSIPVHMWKDCVQ